MRGHLIANNAKLMTDHGVVHFANETVATWRAGLGDNCRTINFCIGATPEYLQALYYVLVKIIEGYEAVAASITLDHTSIDHR